MLAKIERYGDTYFNYLQIGRFLGGKWDQLGQRAETPEESELIDGVTRLAKRDAGRIALFSDSSAIENAAPPFFNSTRKKISHPRTHLLLPFSLPPPPPPPPPPQLILITR